MRRPTASRWRSSVACPRVRDPEATKTCNLDQRPRTDATTKTRPPAPKATVVRRSFSEGGNHEETHEEDFLFEEVFVPQLSVRSTQLLLRVHHDRAVPRDRFLDRFARHEQEANSLVARLDDHLVAVVEQHKRPIAGPVRR